MASIEEALIAALIADTDVAAIVGSNVFIIGGRSNSAYPYVTLQRISTVGTAVLDGPSNLDRPRFQIDCWSDRALQALALAETIRVVLDTVELTAAGITFTATFQDQRGPAPDEETRNFRVGQDYFVFHERT